MGHLSRHSQAQPTSLATLALLEVDTSYRTVWRWLATIGIGVLVLLFLPWQQTVQGTGIVTALAPQDRPQILPSRIDGRVERWLVDEGAFVTAGTPLVEIVSEPDMRSGREAAAYGAEIQRLVCALHVRSGCCG